MARHYGIPYMGSKQKLVDKIVPFILARHPDTTDFYDLFGGGGSVALYAVRKYPDINVHYNELSSSISALMQHLKDGGDIPFDFYTKAEFEKYRYGSDWKAGILQVCWTFGNNGKHYLYALGIQDFKKEIAQLAITGKADIAFIEKFANEFILKTYGKTVDTKLFINTKRYQTTYQRRIVIQRQIPLIGQLQHIARLERLVQIQNMPGISDLKISTAGYDEVPITGKRPILYCDPPYENATEYNEGGFDSKKFYDWVMSREYPVYVSSYKISDERLKLVKAINTRSLLAAAFTEGSVYNYENVYWNGVQ